jgi:hypothetical protein
MGIILEISFGKDEVIVSTYSIFLVSLVAQESFPVNFHPIHGKGFPCYEWDQNADSIKTFTYSNQTVKSGFYRHEWSR